MSVCSCCFMLMPQPDGTAVACRLCGAPVETVVADLGMCPLANAYVTPERLSEMELFYPLRALVCDQCFLVQLEEFEPPERIISDYQYFTSYSATALAHARRFVEEIVPRLGLGAESRVVDAVHSMWASDGPYLLDVTVDVHANAYPKIAFGYPISEMEPFVTPRAMEAT